MVLSIKCQKIMNPRTQGGDVFKGFQNPQIFHLEYKPEKSRTLTSEKGEQANASLEIIFCPSKKSVNRVIITAQEQLFECFLACFCSDSLSCASTANAPGWIILWILTLCKLTSLLQLRSCNQERIMNVEQSHALHQPIHKGKIQQLEQITTLKPFITNYCLS